MTHWKRTIDIRIFWQSNKMSIEDKGKAVAKKIRQAFPQSHFDWQSDNYDDELDQLTEAFENITGFDDVSPVEEFDNWMEELYNYGDNGHQLAIITQF